MNKKDLARDEIIGLPITIKKCTDPEWKGKSGIVIDETKNTFLIRIKNHKDKRIEKKNAIFEFTINEEKIILNGTEIVYRPEERIKKIR
ncbi:MAG: ribonuclease P protein subunit [Candidatus Thermoplasmatota archaeon]|nr:ribonuclease P protein subunit [Candidatus Thermoplasmatota archaeon]